MKVMGSTPPSGVHRRASSPGTGGPVRSVMRALYRVGPHRPVTRPVTGGQHVRPSGKVGREMPRAALTLLGGFAARGAANDPVRFPRRKVVALLAYLACGGAPAHPRDKLSALLWPDASAPQARHSLRQTLASLRQRLPPGGLRVEDATVALDLKAVDVDALTFRRLVSEGTPAAHAQAAALYVGDLLAGIDVKDAAPFEEWLLSERE